MEDSMFSAKIQDPLVPPEVAFPSYTWTPINNKAVTDGELSFLSGDGFKAAIMLMMQSWRETPATSLPDDPKKLAAYCGFGRGPAALDLWDAVKDEALSDFTLCSDGRWYSRTLQSNALEAWESRQQQIARTKKAREAKAENRRSEENAPASETISVTEPVTGTATTPVTASIGDQTRSEGTRSEGRVSEGTGPGVTSGKGGVGVEGGAGGWRRQRTPHQGPVLGTFETPHVTINSGIMNRWARQFRNVTDILGAVTEISKDLYRIEEPGRLTYVSRKLQERDEAASLALEDANLPF